MTQNGTGPVNMHKVRAAIWRGWGRERKGTRGSHALAQEQRAALPLSGRVSAAMLVGSRPEVSITGTAQGVNAASALEDFQTSAG